MIEGSRHPLEVVARETGFRDRRHMREAFLRGFGMPPQAVRRRRGRCPDATRSATDGRPIPLETGRIKPHAPSSTTRADLLAERIDLAIRAGQTLEPTLVARRIGAGQQTLIAGPAYLRAHGTPRSQADQPPPDSAETARGGVAAQP